MKGTRPAQLLTGIQLPSGWKIGDTVYIPPTATGGNFSVGYHIEKDTGEKAYLKALDFSGAMAQPDFTIALQGMLEAYNFERELLLRCRDRRLDRIVTAIEAGNVDAPGVAGQLGKVCYLIFELADGDIRDEFDKLAKFDIAWCLRSLHQTAVGLSQLHGVGIAHQDVKPSNVLVFEDTGSKLSDLGCASSTHKTSQTDTFRIAGDPSYAPPDQWYDQSGTRVFEDRCLVDLYHLGSLIFFYFGDCSATSAINSKLKRSQLSGVFVSDLPYIRSAFGEALEELKCSVEKAVPELESNIIDLATQLCEPDPNLRGDTRWSGNVARRCSLTRYISRLDLLARKAEAGML